jgi:hypothetical protein
MEDLLSEMKRCKTVRECFEVATVDTYNEDEAASGWHACLETLFSHYDRVKVLGKEVDLEGFDLANTAVVAICRQGNKKAKVAFESVEFPKPTAKERLWIQAWRKWSHA